MGATISSDSLSRLTFDQRGLIVAIAQDHLSGEIRMVAWMNQEAVDKTLSSGKATFYSRSRAKLWTKGETSGNYLRVKEMHVDCDGDTLLLRVTPEGPSCHTGRPTCFFHRVLPPAGEIQSSPSPDATFVQSLESEIEARTRSHSEKSYTKYLLDRGVDKVGEKIEEEAGELTTALKSESDERVLNESADVIYHLMVGLRLRGLAWNQVIEVLASRANQSGHAEKASRSVKADAQ